MAAELVEQFLAPVQGVPQAFTFRSGVGGLIGVTALAGWA